VKATTSTAFEPIRISSERQLDVDESISLYLIALSLDARPDSGLTLPALIELVQELASDAGCAQQFTDRLSLYGYRPEDESHYSELGYAVRQRAQFQVVGDFPSIAKSKLRAGITDVQYSLALTSLDAYRKTEDELKASLETVA
jgi:hypothetical protein